MTNAMLWKSEQNPPQSGRNTPNEGFFDSRNFKELDVIQRRLQKMKDDGKKREGKMRFTEQRQEEGLTRESSWEKVTRGPCERCVDAAKREEKRGENVLLRRPLAPRCTCMDPTDGGLPVLPVEYPVDIDEWACKPFSTIVGGGVMGYRNHFPLLMQRCTEAEEKDSTQVQTETRRHSVVTTDYLTGRIKLQGTRGENVKLSVFPVLHVVVSSDEDDDDNTFVEGEEEDTSMLDAITALRNKQTLPALEQRRCSVQPSVSPQQRRRLSLTPRGLSSGRGTGLGIGGRPRVIRRRSIDQSSLAQSFASAMEAASGAMDPLFEDQETRCETPKRGFDVKHAEETMVHMAQNLKTLEEFLKGSGSVSSVSDASSDDGEGTN